MHSTGESLVRQKKAVKDCVELWKRNPNRVAQLAHCQRVRAISGNSLELARLCRDPGGADPRFVGAQYGDAMLKECRSIEATAISPPPPVERHFVGECYGLRRSECTKQSAVCRWTDPSGPCLERSEGGPSATLPPSTPPLESHFIGDCEDLRERRACKQNDCDWKEPSGPCRTRSNPALSDFCQRMGCQKNETVEQCRARRPKRALTADDERLLETLRGTRCSKSAVSHSALKRGFHAVAVALGLHQSLPMRSPVFGTPSPQLISPSANQTAVAEAGFRQRSLAQDIREGVFSDVLQRSEESNSAARSLRRR